MEIRSLFAEDDAVSPVIGVILMVAITVILAAVIGAFVLDLGGNTQKTPQASFDFSQSNQTYDDGAGASGEVELITVEITAESGETLQSDNIDLTVDGNTAFGIDTSTSADQTEALWTSGSEIKAGDSVTIAFKDTGTSISGGTDMEYSDSDNTINNPNNAAKLEPGETVRITWESDDGSSSAELQSYEVN